MNQTKKKILITGAAGFVGWHLTEFYVKKGYGVFAFDRYNSFNSFGWLDYSAYKTNIEFILGDIRDYDSVLKAVKKANYVFHLAALIGIPYSYVSPIAYIKTNVEGTYNVLEASKHNNIDQVLITSTSEVYGSAQTKSIDEKHAYNAQSPYAASKVAADHLSLSYYKSFGTPVKIVRPFNTYGPRQSARAIIPTILSQALRSKEIKLGNTDTTRDLTYVEDTCRGFYNIFKNSSFFGDVVNIGSNNEITPKQIVKEVEAIRGHKLKIKSEKLRKRPKKSEVLRLRCNFNKLNKKTGWKSEYSFKAGLKKTYQWMNTDEFQKFYKSKKYII